MTGSDANPSTCPEQLSSLPVPAPHRGRFRHTIRRNLIGLGPLFQRSFSTAWERMPERMRRFRSGVLHVMPRFGSPVDGGLAVSMPGWSARKPGGSHSTPPTTSPALVHMGCDQFGVDLLDQFHVRLGQWG
jgi:hypothetical protein